jgi:hypothetical protein
LGEKPIALAFASGGENQERLSNQAKPAGLHIGELI